MQLLFIPVVLAIAGFWFNHRERRAAEVRAEAERNIEQQRSKAEQEIALDNQREAALQAYINSMSELLLHEKLRESAEDDEVRRIARVRTLTVLPHLDMRRKKSVVQFLYESDLIDKNKCIVNLRDANLRGALLYKANLREANLCEAFLGEAILTGAEMNRANLAKARMPEANLRGAKLNDANLREAELRGADLSYANLSRADLSRADFEEADLSGANLEAANVYLAQLYVNAMIERAIRC
jgi:uncharacterized protein YjbI with pentapeptide repeats